MNLTAAAAPTTCQPDIRTVQELVGPRNVRATSPIDQWLVVGFQLSRAEHWAAASPAKQAWDWIREPPESQR